VDEGDSDGGAMVIGMTDTNTTTQVPRLSATEMALIADPSLEGTIERAFIIGFSQDDGIMQIGIGVVLKPDLEHSTVIVTFTCK
jgi:hypothetical protein